MFPVNRIKMLESWRKTCIFIFAHLPNGLLSDTQRKDYLSLKPLYLFMLNVYIWPNSRIPKIV